MDSNKTCVLVLGLPKGSFCGIDLLSFTTTPRFQGIKHIPPGWHFLFTGVDSAFSIRHGLWFYAPPSDGNVPEVLMFEWMDNVEELVEVQDETTRQRLKANVDSLWEGNLTPYRQSVAPGSVADDGLGDDMDSGTIWRSLTDCISEQLLDKIIGKTNGRSVWKLTSASSARQDVDDIPGLTSTEAATTSLEKELNFLPVNLKQTWPNDAIGRERTEAAQDRSWALNDLVQKYCHDIRAIIGELQMTWVVVLTVNNNSCLEQWKRILGLVLTCKSAVTQQTSFFTGFLEIVKLQLQRCSDAEDGLFDMSDNSGNLLKSLLKRFRQGLEQLPGSEAKVDVLDGLDDLEDFLRGEHGWLMNEAHVRRGTFQLEDGDQVEVDMNGVDEDEEEGDFAPAFVELTPDLAAQLGLDTDIRSGKAGQIPVSREAAPATHIYDEDDRDLEEMDARY